MNEEELYQCYKQEVRNGQLPNFKSEEWMSLFSYLSIHEKEEEAFHVLENAMTAYPDYHPFAIIKVKLDLYDGFFDEALSILEGQLAGAPDNEVRALWIDYYFSLGDDAQAEELLEELLRDKPDYLESALEYLIPIFRDVDDESLRLTYAPYVQKAVELFPKNIVLLEEWRDELKAQKRLDEAIAISNRLIDLEPFSFDSWNELAYLYVQQERFEEAIDAFDFALTINEDKDRTVPTKIMKGYCLYMNGSYEKAIEVYKEFEGDQVSELHVRALLAHCQVHLQRYDEAMKMLKELISHDELESYALSINDYALCCLSKGDRQSAYLVLKEAVNKRPLDKGLLMMYSLVGIFNGMDQVNEIKKTFDRSMSLLSPTINDPTITSKCYKLLEIGKYYLEMGDKENARVYLDLVLRTRPDIPSLNELVTRVFEEEKDPVLLQI